MSFPKVAPRSLRNLKLVLLSRFEHVPKGIENEPFCDPKRSPGGLCAFAIVFGAAYPKIRPTLGFGLFGAKNYADYGVGYGAA